MEPADLLDMDIPSDEDQSCDTRERGPQTRFDGG
jgi:hypothetical protein